MPNNLTQNSNPALSIKEITDIFVRKNFENLRQYFNQENQLLGFRFFELNFDSAQTNYKFPHGLGFKPEDVMITKVAGGGYGYFEVGLFDNINAVITVSGACRIRFYLGSYWNQIPTGQDTVYSRLFFGEPALPSVGVGGVVASAIANKTVRAVVKSDTPTDSDDVLIMSGTSFTLTLPTAVGRPGKTFTIAHAGVNGTNVYTLNTTSAQTVGGYASAAYNFYLNRQKITVVSDGANWIIVDQYLPPTSFLAYLGANQNVNPNNSNVKINIDTVVHDNLGAFDAVNKRFNVKCTAYWQFVGTWGANNTNVIADFYSAKIFVNGIQVMFGPNGIGSVGTGPNRQIVTPPWLVNNGDYVELWMYGAGNNSTNQLQVGLGNAITNFGGHIVNLIGP